MWRKIIDDYKLYCLNDLLEIKWIFYSLRIVCCNFLNLHGR